MNLVPDDKRKVFEYLEKAAKPEYENSQLYTTMKGYIRTSSAQIWEAIEDGDQTEIENLIAQLMPNEEARMSAIRHFGLAGCWFVAFKRANPMELYRLYELNLFLFESFGVIRSYKPVHQSHVVDWITPVLTKVYDEVLVKKIDPTIFYSKDFVESHFPINSSYEQKDLNVAQFFKRLVTANGQVDSFLDKTLNVANQGDRELLTKLLKSNQTLDFHYNKGDADMDGNIARFRNITSRPHGKVADLNARLFMLKMMQHVFRLLSTTYHSTSVNRASTVEEQEQVASQIEKIFSEFAEYATDEEKGEKANNLVVFIGLLSTIKKNLKIDTGPLTVIMMHEARMINWSLAEYDEKSSVLESLFHDEEYDRNLKMNRDKYRWLLPFERERFTNARPEDSRLRNEITIQENRLWITLLQLQFYKKSIRKEEKRKNKLAEQQQKKKKPPPPQPIKKNSDISKKSQKKEKDKKKKSNKEHATTFITISDSDEEDDRNKRKATESLSEKDGKNAKKKKLQTVVTLSDDGTTILNVISGMARLMIGKYDRIEYEIHPGKSIEIPAGTHYEIGDCNSSYDE